MTRTTIASVITFAMGSFSLPDPSAPWYDTASRRRTREETMADPQKPMTLEDLARMEADALKKREQSKLDRVEGEKKIVVAMPERFFSLAKQLREGVRRFNTAAPIERPLQYNESAA